MNTINTLKAHLAINVRDVDESIAFYKKMLGIEPSKVRTGYAKFDVASPPLNFTLNQVPFNERGTDCDSVCEQGKGDVSAGQAFGHYSRTDHRSEQHRRAYEFSGKPPRQIVLHWSVSPPAFRSTR